MGDFAKAEELLSKSTVLSDNYKNWPTYCFALIYFGCLELEKGNYDQAVKHLEKAKAINESNKYFKDYTLRLYPALIDAYIKQKELYSGTDSELKTKNIKELGKLCKKTLKITRPWLNHYGAALRANAEYCDLLNKNKSAESYFQKSIEQTKDLGRKYELAKSYFEYSKFLKKLDRSGEALNNILKAYEVFSQIGAKAYINKCVEMIRSLIPSNSLNSVLANTQPSSKDRLKYERSLNTVLNTSRYISSILEFEELLEKVMDSAMELVGAERGILLLYQEDGERNLEVRSVRNVTNEEINSKEFKASMTIISSIEKEQIPLIVTDALTDENLKNQSSVVLNNIRSVLCTPIMTQHLEACKISLGHGRPNFETEIDKAINISREGLKEVRRSVSGLLPVKLEVYDLYTALKELISEFQVSGMNIDFSFKCDYEIKDSKLSDTVYRTCQEALTNSLRHGKAQNVTIAVKKIDEILKIYIVDDGLGCKDIKKGFGLTNMEKRILDFKGSIIFNSDGEHGMYIMARELSIIKQIAEGKNNKEVAESLFLAEGRVKNIITGILSKLNLRYRTQLVVFAIKNNLV